MSANTFSANTTLTIASISKTASSVTAPASSTNLSIVGKVYNLVATAATTGTNITSFSKSVALEFKYNTADLPAGAKEADLSIYYFDETTSLWTKVTSVVDAVNKKITANVSHFTKFAILASVTALQTQQPITPAPQNVTTGKQAPQATTPTLASLYNFEYVGQSAYPHLVPGATGTLSLTLKNTGTATWSKSGSNPARLGTSKAKDRSSILHNNTWVGNNRAATIDKDSIAPGETAIFTFAITAPSNPGKYKEYFQPVVDGLGWMSGGDSNPLG
ncbi:MAG: Curculin domain protein (Mannose-binding) lectin [Microgenomates group bacterium GW2011_GWA2_46_7]|nr:MAG: Curculin domain protein (Mannose-binding) lectin [Microgenomates group bacterium GW2011_GWA2_46_7]